MIYSHTFAVNEVLKYLQENGLYLNGRYFFHESEVSDDKFNFPVTSELQILQWNQDALNLVVFPKRRRNLLLGGDFFSFQTSTSHLPERHALVIWIPCSCLLMSIYSKCY